MRPRIAAKASALLISSVWSNAWAIEVLREGTMVATVCGVASVYRLTEENPLRISSYALPVLVRPLPDKAMQMSVIQNALCVSHLQKYIE